MAVSGTIRGNGFVNGTDQNDTLLGGAGNDTLNGGKGADSMEGGKGDDTYVVDDLHDVVKELANEGKDTVLSSALYVLGDNVEDLTLTGNGNISGYGNALDNKITGNDGNNTLVGYAGNDTLLGGAGNDTLLGGKGTDSMEGGTGDDIYVVESAGDAVKELANEGRDTVQSSIDYGLGDNVEDLTLTGPGNVVGTSDLKGDGNALDNRITGNDGANSLSGFAGNDTLLGGKGNDTLHGGAGTDSMEGGAGDDTYVVDNAGDVAKELANEGRDKVESSIDNTLGANLEDLTLTGTGDLKGEGNGLANKLTGNDGRNTLLGGKGSDTLDGGEGNDSLSGGEGNDTLLGNIGNDILDGGMGADTMQGGVGDDTYVVDDVGDVVKELANEGRDQVESSIDYVLGTSIEDLTLTGLGSLGGYGNSLDNKITGNDWDNPLNGRAGNDTLVGGKGNDWLIGGEGADSMEGGTGDDNFFVDDAGDIVKELTNEGNDTVQSSIDYTLGANLEDLTLTGTADLNGGGNSLNNGITGNDGNNSLFGLVGSDTLYGYEGKDTLDGGKGADSMDGGAGDDTYVVDNGGDVVKELAGEGRDKVQSSIGYTLGENVEDLTLTGTGDLNGTGNTLDNKITGNEGINHLSGLEGNDSLIGNEGNDTLLGGAGADTLYGDRADTVPGANGNDSLDGGDGDDTLYGGDGNDTLTGGTGADRMEGGAGGDEYWVDNVGDEVIEVEDGRIGNNNVVNSAAEWTTYTAAMKAKGAPKTDTVNASITYTLGDHVEVLALKGEQDLKGTGNGLNNAITGNKGSNLLKGLEGSDQIWGGAGNDTLEGGNGDDWLDGGYAKDELTGGEGNDAFVFGVNFTTGTDGAGRLMLNASSDTVKDFKAGEDYVVLSRNAFAKLNTGATLDSSAFTLGTKSSSADTRVIYDQAKGQLWYDADGSGSGFKQVLIATFDKVGDTHPELSVSDFLLIA